MHEQVRTIIRHCQTGSWHSCFFQHIDIEEAEGCVKAGELLLRWEWRFWLSRNQGQHGEPLLQGGQRALQRDRHGGRHQEGVGVQGRPGQVLAGVQRRHELDLQLHWQLHILGFQRSASKRGHSRSSWRNRPQELSAMVAPSVGRFAYYFLKCQRFFYLLLCSTYPSQLFSAVITHENTTRFIQKLKISKNCTKINIDFVVTQCKKSKYKCRRNQFKSFYCIENISYFHYQRSTCRLVKYDHWIKMCFFFLYAFSGEVEFCF